MSNGKLPLVRVLCAVGLILGTVFLCLSIFREDAGNGYLSLALGSILIVNILNLFANKNHKNK